MAAIVLLLGFLGAILLPILLASMIADLTPMKVIALLTVFLLIGGYFIVRDSDAFQTLYWQWSLPSFPPDETAFTAAAEELRELRMASVTHADRGAALRQVEARLCALPAVIDDWAGRVEQRYLISSGEGASLTIGITPHLEVRTAFFPDNTGTLIHQGTPLFAQANELEQGDLVRFSGRLVGHAGACPDDPPIDPNEQLRDPEFLVQFSHVAKAEDR
jgi:hypothetical protein